MSTLGTRLKLLRAGLSQQAMATMLGIPQTTWSNYEQDKNKPDFALLDKICLEFQVHADWLLFERGDMRAHGFVSTEKQLSHIEKQASPKQANCSVNSAQGCQKCLELFERLYQTGEQEKSLLKENASLRERLAYLEEYADGVSKKGTQKSTIDAPNSAQNVPFNGQHNE